MPFKNPGLPDQDPKQVYYENLQLGPTLTWYTQKAGPEELVPYVLDLLGFEPSGLVPGVDGSAEDLNGSLHLHGIRSGNGAALTVWVFNDSGGARVDEALQLEQRRLEESMMRGLARHPAGAWPVQLNHGRAVDSSEWGELFAIMNDGEIFELTPWASAERKRSAEKPPPPIGLDPEVIEKVLEHDSDVVSYERVHGFKAMWKARVRVDDGPTVVVHVDNGINDLYCQLWIPIDALEVPLALQAVAPFAPAGIAKVANGYWLRVGLLAPLSPIEALSNALRIISLACYAHMLLVDDSETAAAE